jgi:ribosomal protein S18 acetylase RimI-like enzyme
MCFGHEMDAAGRSVVREMRTLSRFGPALRVLNLFGFTQPPWDQGYVWVEAGRVVGSVSTTRSRPGSKKWLIANVAVHPDHRRRGMALALTQATLDLIRSLGGTEAILQVDDDNLGAIELYRRLGFSHVTTVTSWARPAHTPAPPHQPAPFDIRLRAPREWAEQLALAALVRPSGLAWDRPLHARDFAPDLIKRLDQFLNGQAEEHWVVEVQNRLVGSLMVRLNIGEGDRLTLLVHPDYGGQLERPLLVRGLRRLAPRPWPTHIEHPADDEGATRVLKEMGFQPRRTLRWMQVQVR